MLKSERESLFDLPKHQHEYIDDIEKAGDPDNRISTGTKFEDLPASWICPICGAEKTGFEQQE